MYTRLFVLWLKTGYVAIIFTYTDGESKRADHFRRRQYAQQAETGSKNDVRIGRQRDMDRHKALFNEEGRCCVEWSPQIIIQES